MEVKVETVSTAGQRRDFLHLPWRIYAGDANWVPPLLVEMRRIIDPRRNAYLGRGANRLLIAYGDGGPVGRIAAGTDEIVNSAKESRRGWFSLFECVQDYEVARALLDAARNYLIGLGSEGMRGPVSPTGGDDYRGLLVEGFDAPPVLMNSYNPPYYRDFFERYGLDKYEDLFAYRFSYQVPRSPRAVAYAQARYGYHLDCLNLGNLDRDVRDIKSIVDRAMPASWSDMIPPSLAEIREMAATLKAHADPDLVFIARAGGEPIGFNVTLPDLNQAFIHMNGRLWPFGWLKFLRERRKIDGLRFFILFVVPEWRKKGVTASIFLKTYETAAAKGITWGEGSTIGETNQPMRHDVERAGGVHYKTYRIYHRGF